MAKYIDCDAAIALAKDIIVPTKSVHDYRHRCIDPQDLAELPAADVVERKRGKWMPSSLTWSYYNYDCSVCGCNEFRQVDHNGGYKAFNFCPNCGAKMEVQE